MTGENFRFVRHLTRPVRIRRIREKNRDEYRAFLKEDPAFREEFRGSEMEDFGLVYEGEPAGAIRLATVEDHLEVADLQVKETLRRMGFGSALLIKAKEYAMEQGFSLVAAGIPDDREDLITFFEENGYFPSTEGDEGTVMIWEEEAETEELLSSDEKEAREAFEEAVPPEAVLIPKLMRLKALLQTEGIGSEVVSGENTYLWCETEMVDVQLSYLPLDDSYSPIYLLFSSFVEVEGSEEELAKLCHEINRTNFFVTAYPDTDGIGFRYTLREGNRPVDENEFLSAFSEFHTEVFVAALKAGEA